MIDKLLEFYNEEPGDPFNSYAIALEYAKTDTNQAIQWFRKLLTGFPDYLPAYYHAAALFADLGYVEEAEETYKRGISLASEQPNLKPLQELQRAYRGFRDEMDDL